MYYFFVHAPNRKGWNGEILLALSSVDGPIEVNHVQDILHELYKKQDIRHFHVDNDPSTDNIKAFLDRKERGMMQRRSVFGTYEDLYYDEWLKGFSRHYPSLSEFASMLLPTIFSQPTEKEGL